MSEQKKGNAHLFAYGSDFNALHYFVRQLILSTVNVCIPVRVDTVERNGVGNGAGYISATPLVCQLDGDGKRLEPVSIPRLPYFRLQHGTAAIVCDPVPGDVGLAIFAQQDTSKLTGQNEPSEPGSFRVFDMSDGFYLGGFWGPAPKTFIHIEQSGDIVVTAPTSDTVNSPRVTVNCDTAKVVASQSVTVDTPTTTITGDATIKKNLTVAGKITGAGGLSISGDVTATGDVTAGGISVQNHTHPGDSGGTTGKAQ